MANPMVTHSPRKAETVDAEAAEVTALLRRIKRLGIRELEFSRSGGQLVLRAKVQRGRAHERVETEPHDDQLSALRAIAAEVGAARNAGKRRKGKPTARRVARPEAGKPGDEVDTRTLADMIEELPPAQHARREAAAAKRRADEKARRSADAERVAARHQPNRPPQLPPGRQGGR